MRLRKRKWVDPYLMEEKDYLLRDSKYFVADKPVILEIGMGMGDWIIESAELYPYFHFIGLEKDPTCCAKAIQKAKEKGITNFSVIRGDATYLLELIAADSVSRIYLHFSDPWPKKGYHKRRLTYPTFLEMYRFILKDGGELIFKTDNTDFFADSLEYFENSPFEIVDVDRDYHSVKRDEPVTGYERKFMEQGLPISFLRAKKKQI